ncbi:hypothetical protein Syun_025361 [Stephania yunnanensis]|uniref:Uncharacterized protein n=1 Tax=Stephania yunnanensis TaxID=152371 RepID=A0AAP0ERJ2_9MAGN
MKLDLLQHRGFIDQLALLMIDSILALLCLVMFISPIVYFSTLSPSTITTTGPIKVSQSSPYFLYIYLMFANYLRQCQKENF